MPMTPLAIAVFASIIVVLLLWPLRQRLAALNQTRPGRALAAATIAAMTLHTLLTSSLIPSETYAHKTSVLQARATALQERYNHYKIDFAALGTMPAKGSQDFAAWTARRKSIEDERLAAGAATDQLAADLKVHIANPADTAAQADTANGWAFFASLICFVMVGAASYIYTGRLNRS